MGPETPGAGGVCKALRPSGQVRRGESWAADQLSSLQDTGPCGCRARGRPEGPPGHGSLCASRTTRLVPALTPGEPVPVTFPRDGRAWNTLKEASDVLSPAQRPRAGLGSFTCGQRPAWALIGPLSGRQCIVRALLLAGEGAEGPGRGCVAGVPPRSRPSRPQIWLSPLHAPPERVLPLPEAMSRELRGSREARPPRTHGAVASRWPSPRLRPRGPSSSHPAALRS